MGTFTANYNLFKPDGLAGGDLVDVEAAINDSMDIIDAELFDHETRVDALEGLTKGIERKTANETRDSNTFSADGHLVTPSLAAGTYEISLYMIVRNTGSVTPDFKARLSWTGTMNVSVAAQFPLGLTGSSAADIENVGLPNDVSSPTDAVIGACTATWNVYHLVASVVVSVAGVLTLEWAQNNTDAVNTTEMATGSWLRWERFE